MDVSFSRVWSGQSKRFQCRSSSKCNSPSRWCGFWFPPRFLHRLLLISPHLNGEQSAVLPDLKDSHLCLLWQSEFTCRSPKLATCCTQGFCCFFFFNRASNVLGDSAVNCGLTLHLSGFISCVFGSGILSPAIVVIETICVSSESPLNPWLLSGLGMCV